MAQPAPHVGVTVSKFEGAMPSSLIRGLKLLGMDFIELNMSIFPEIDKIAGSLGRIITAFHLPLVGEDGWDFSCSRFQGTIDKAIETLNSNKEKLHIHHVVCHPPEAEEAAQRVDSSLDTLFKNLAKLDLPVHLENVPSVTPERFGDIYNQAGSALGSKLAGICFDAPHFFIRGHNPLEQYQKLSDSIASIHLSDCLSDQDVHMPFNSGGSLPVQDFLQAVKTSAFHSFITLEIRPHSLKELDSYFNSYLLTLKFVNPPKYLASKFRIFALRPFIRRFAA